jgi:hypothetical protein
VGRVRRARRNPGAARYLLISFSVLPFGIRFNLAPVALLAVIACLEAGCSVPFVGDCERDEHRCTADGVETCELTEVGTRWQKKTCRTGAACVEGAYLCAVGGAKDPRCSAFDECDGSPCVTYGEVCDGTAIVSCDHGYATYVTPCLRGEACSSTGSVHCFPSPTLDPACTNADPASNYYVCDDGASLRCKGAYLVRMEYCPPYQCITAQGGGGCVPVGPPSPICADVAYLPQAQIVCDGSTAITCALGYVMRRQVCRSCSPGASAVPCTGALLSPCATTSDCADGFVCRANQWGKLACSGPCAIAADCTAMSRGTAEESAAPSAGWACVNGWCE